MIARAIRLLQTRGAVAPDFEEPVGQLRSMFALHPLQPLPHRFSHRVRHALSRKARQLPRQLVGVTVFDIQAHVWKMFYLLLLPFYHNDTRCFRQLITRTETFRLVWAHN